MAKTGFYTKAETEAKIKEMIDLLRNVRGGFGVIDTRTGFIPDRFINVRSVAQLVVQFIGGNTGGIEGSSPPPAAGEAKIFSTDTQNLGVVGTYAKIWQSPLSPSKSYEISIYGEAVSSLYTELNRPAGGIISVSFHTASTGSFDPDKCRFISYDYDAQEGDFILGVEGTNLCLYVRKTSSPQSYRFFPLMLGVNVTEEQFIEGGNYQPLNPANIRKVSFPAFGIASSITQVDIDNWNASHEESGQNDALYIPATDFFAVSFERKGGFIIGTKDLPVNSSTIPLDLTNARKFCSATVYIYADSEPTILTNGASINVLGEFVTSQVNEVAFVNMGNGNVTIGFLNSNTAIQEGLVEFGLLEYTSTIALNVSGFSWRLASALKQSGVIIGLAVLDSPTLFPRNEILVGTSAGTVVYIPGIEAEDQPYPGRPVNTVLLANMVRYPNGDIDIIDPGTDVSDFVSKSKTTTQELAGDLRFLAQAGVDKRLWLSRFDDAGTLSAIRADKASMYSTKEGAVGWSKILTLNMLNFTTQQYYGASLFAVVKRSGAESVLGMVGLYVTMTTAGILVTKSLTVDRDLLITDFLLIRTSTNEFSLFFKHEYSVSLLSWRPAQSVGSLDKASFIHLPDILSSLPAGTQYDFEKIGLPETWVHVQGVASNTWVIPHPLKKFAIPVFLDSTGRVIEGDYHWNGIGEVVGEFNAVFSGSAILN